MRTDEPFEVMSFGGGSEPKEGAARPLGRRAGGHRIEKGALRHNSGGGTRKGQAAGGSLLHGVVEGGIDLVVEVHDEQAVTC